MGSTEALPPQPASLAVSREFAVKGRAVGGGLAHWRLRQPRPDGAQPLPPHDAVVTSRDNRGVFGGFEAALAFLMLVMPGLLLIGGYYGGLGRPQALSMSALHTLAQAIAWSLVLLIPAAWCVAGDLAT